MKFFSFSKKKESGNHLDNYLDASLKFRSSIRKGTIVILERGFDMTNFLKVLSWQGGLQTDIVRETDFEKVRSIVLEIGENSIKSIIIDGDEISSESGIEFLEWFIKNYPKIPIWVGNCKEEKKTWLKQTIKRVGIFSVNEPIENIIKSLGFSSKCLENSEKLRYRCVVKT